MTKEEIKEGSLCPEIQDFLGGFRFKTNRLKVAVPKPKSPAFTVSSTQVVFDEYETVGSSNFLVKFTDEEYSLRQEGSRLQLGTAGYYRGEGPDCYRDEPKEDDAHIDRQESAIHIPRGAYAISTRLGSDPTPKPVLLRVLPSEDNWMFCTSAIGFGGLDQALNTTKKFIDHGRSAYSVIERDDIEEFAFLLGLRYGLDASTRIGEIYYLGNTPGGVPGLYENNKEYDYLLQVFHGRVKYVDDPSEFILKYARDDDMKCLLPSFIKRTKFSYQSEYRFIIHGWGHLRIQKTLLPLEKDIRRMFSSHGRTRDLFEKLQRRQRDEP